MLGLADTGYPTIDITQISISKKMHSFKKKLFLGANYPIGTEELGKLFYEDRFGKFIDENFPFLAGILNFFSYVLSPKISQPVLHIYLCYCLYHPRPFRPRRRRTTRII